MKSNDWYAVSSLDWASIYWIVYAAFMWATNNSWRIELI